MSLFENRTYENLMDEALDRADSCYDKRPGSMLWNGNAPCLAELAQLYTALDFVFDATYITTAPREYLIKRAADRSITPHPATPAQHLAAFNIAVPVGSRFSCEDLNFSVVNFPDGALVNDNGLQLVECETVGSVGSEAQYTGRLVPIEYIDRLSRAELQGVYTYGENEEDTEVFRARLLEAMRSIAFGGNQADYRARVLDIDGIGQCKVHPVWNGDIAPSSLIPSDAVYTAAQTAVDDMTDAAVKAYLTALLEAGRSKKLTVGGTVRLVVMSSNSTSPAVESEKLGDVQTLIDPETNAGEGLGLAPIGHVVKVESVKPEALDVVLQIELQNGYTTAQAQDSIAAVLKTYFAELSDRWQTTGDGHLRVLFATVIQRVLDDEDCKRIIATVDTVKIANAAVNANFDLATDSVPVLGRVIVNG